MDFLLSLGSWFMVGLVILAVGAVALAVSFFQKVEQGKALIVNTMGAKPVVTFTGYIVLPVVHKSEIMDISLKTIEIDRRGREGLICRDNIRADIKVAFFVRVNPTPDDVVRVAQSIGCARASDPDTLEELFSAKFSEALKTVGKQLDFEDLYKERDSFRDKIIDVIGKDLNGYVLEDAAIDYLEQTPLSSLDPSNILDSQGIRKITELTSVQHVETNHFENQERMRIAQQNADAQEKILEQDRRRADAEAKQKREIRNVQDREQAEIETVAAQERLRSESARIQTDQQIAIQEHNKQREIEVAEQNRQRVVGIETERVKLARELEVITRERESELQRIAKEKALEEERRDIANVIRERTAVERTVAEEEERTKEVREVAEADRAKQVRIIHAEAEAQEALVTDIKKAEAAQQAAEFKAREKIILAESEREAAEKLAAAKIRLAEGAQAEAAADGLAEVRVKEANALAIEKEGAAKAKALQDEMQARAAGSEQQGLAEARVREANAAATEKEGAAKAKALQDEMLAKAAGIEQQGLAQARVQEAEAGAVEKRGLAEASALEERLLAEAKGLAEKFKSLEAIEGGRGHEEFRMELEQQLAVQKAAFGAQVSIAERQAVVLAEAFKNAKIEIVGGDQQFFERMMSAVSTAKSLDGFVRQSDVTRRVLRDYLEHDASLVQDVKELLGNLPFSSEDVKNMSLAAFLAKLSAAAGSPEQKAKLEGVLKWLGGTEQRAQ